MRASCRFTLAVLLSCAVVPSVQAQPSAKPTTQHTKPLNIDKFFTASVVVDGNMNYISPSGLGQPDFRDVKAKTEIDFWDPFGSLPINAHPEPTTVGTFLATEAAAFFGADNPAVMAALTVGAA